ncbi:hypothetical protein fugu_019703 [Takifugu bimaculatus]|uniref:Uncharacterized protein n=1 Tax=Takifugu bimaculatus TaxID=433685 RepID=A0A4Z2BGA6_9TELE|nr:hypothetical protein fugu_019703 [Takifugu bimaculatus]
MNFHSFNQKRNEENCRLRLRDNGKGFSHGRRDLQKVTGMIVKPHRDREKAERLYQQYFICSDKRKERRGALRSPPPPPPVSAPWDQALGTGKPPAEFKSSQDQSWHSLSDITPGFLVSV